MTYEKIIYFIITLISQIIIFYIFNEIASKKIKITKTLKIVVLISSIIETVLSIVMPVLNVVYSIIYFIIMLKIFYKIKMKEVIFCNIIVWFLLISLDIMTMSIFNILQNNIIYFKLNIAMSKQLGTLIMNGLLVIIVKTKIFKKLVTKLKMFFQKINKTIYIAIIILSIYFILGSISVTHIEYKMIVMPILTITIILSILIISMIIIKYENITLKQTNAILIKNNEFYTKLLDNYRILKHNLISQLIGIKSVSNKNTKKLIDDLIKQYNETYNTTQYIKEMPSKVSGIIYEKLYNFKQKDIKLTVDNKIKNDLFNLISPRSYNLLCEALGVLFDNAMEATSETKEKIIYLKFEEKEEEIKITIINTFVGKIDIEKIGSKNYTHKENGHGLGLYSLMGRNKLQIKYHIKNNLFFSEIFIEKRI